MTPHYFRTIFSYINGYCSNENDDYYQDGYFWNGTEWVVADEEQHGNNEEIGDNYASNDDVEEELVPEPQQSALAMIGGEDMLGIGSVLCFLDLSFFCLKFLL